MSKGFIKRQLPSIIFTEFEDIIGVFSSGMAINRRGTSHIGEKTTPDPVSNTVFNLLDSDDLHEKNKE